MKGSIRRHTAKDGTVRYYPLVWLDGKQKSLGGFSTKRDAEARLRSALAEIAEGTFGQKPPEDILFLDFAQRWLTDIARPSLKPRTFDTYELIVRKHLVPVFGPTILRDIRPTDVQAMISREVGNGAAPRTSNSHLKILSAILQQAKVWGLLQDNPCDLVKRPKVIDKEMEFLSFEEGQRLLSEVTPKHYAFFATALLTGLRVGELTGLKWMDFDPGQAVLFVRRAYHPDYGFTAPKSAYSRRAVSLSPELVRILEVHRENVGGGPGDLAFISEEGGPLDYHNIVNRHFHPALERAGLKRVRLHDLRHSYAAMMITLGCNLKWLQRQMGHASLSTTMDTYGHLIQDAGLDMGRKLDSAFFSENVVSIKASR